METVQKSDDAQRAQYTLSRVTSTLVITVQKTSDGSLQYTISVNMAASSNPESWQSFTENLERGVTVENV